MKTQEVPIEWEGQPAVVTIKKWDFGERNTYLERAQTGREAGLKTSLEQAVLLGVIKAPWPLNDINEVRKLDPDVADPVAKQVVLFNKIVEEKKDDSAGPSGTGLTAESSTSG